MQEEILKQVDKVWERKKGNNGSGKNDLFGNLSLSCKSRSLTKLTQTLSVQVRKNTAF